MSVSIFFLGKVQKNSLCELYEINRGQLHNFWMDSNNFAGYCIFCEPLINLL